MQNLLEKLPCPAMACRQLADRLTLAQDMWFSAGAFWCSSIAGLAHSPHLNQISKEREGMVIKWNYRYRAAGCSWARQTCSLMGWWQCLPTCGVNLIHVSENYQVIFAWHFQAHDQWLRCHMNCTTKFGEHQSHLESKLKLPSCCHRSFLAPSHPKPFDLIYTKILISLSMTEMLPSCVSEFQPCLCCNVSCRQLLQRLVHCCLNGIKFARRQWKHHQRVLVGAEIGNIGSVVFLVVVVVIVFIGLLICVLVSILLLNCVLSLAVLVLLVGPFNLLLTWFMSLIQNSSLA